MHSREKKMMRRNLLLATVALGGLLGLSFGCHGGADDGLTDAQRAKGAKLSSLVTKSGGDWNKLSPDEQQYLVKEVGYGSEKTAQDYLTHIGRHGGRPGGPPTGGAPAAPATGSGQ